MASRRRKRFPWGWVVVGLVIAGGGAYYFWQQQQAAASSSEIPKGVQIGKAERGVIEQTIHATGVVAAQTGAKVNIGSQITGRIKSLPADVGTSVSANQVIAVLDSPDLQAQVEQQQRNVEGARAAVSQAESRLRQASLNAGLTEEQTKAQIQEAEFSAAAASERLKMADATSRLQPSQTSADIARAEATLSTARSQERQVKATVALTLRQSNTDIDDAQALVDNTRVQLVRQQSLLSQGYLAKQEVDDTRTTLKRAMTRLENSRAALEIVKEKNAADLQAAHDKVGEAEEALKAAKAGRLQDEVRNADLQNSTQALKQAQATLRLRKASKMEDVIRQSAIQEARSSLLQSRASLQQSEALLRYQQAQLAKSEIRSPIDGVVLTIAAQQGETIAAGFSAPTLITVADLNRLEVRSYVDEVDIGKVRIGLPAEVRVDAFSDRTFKGRVSKISAASTVKDNVVTYETTISLENPGKLLRPDMTADITLLLGRRPEALLVPSESLHREMKRTLVYVLHRDKKDKERVEARTITPGVDDGNHSEVLGGIKEGEEVVLAGLPRLGVQASDSQEAGRNGKKKDQ